jgi:hypothetical protein
MSGMAKTKLSYEKFDGKLVIYTATNSNDTILFKNFGFSKNKELIIEDRALVNKEDEELYVIRSDFDKNPDLYIFIDGKKYKQDSGITDGYGLVRRKPRRNWRLEWKMKSIDGNKYEIIILKGYDAYREYGYKYAFGVAKLSRKE